MTIRWSTTIASSSTHGRPIRRPCQDISNDTSGCHYRRSLVVASAATRQQPCSLVGTPSNSSFRPSQSSIHQRFFNSISNPAQSNPTKTQLGREEEKGREREWKRKRRDSAQLNLAGKREREGKNVSFYMN